MISMFLYLYSHIYSANVTNEKWVTLFPLEPKMRKFYMQRMFLCLGYNQNINPLATSYLCASPTPQKTGVGV